VKASLAVHPEETDDAGQTDGYISIVSTDHFAEPPDLFLNTVLRPECRLFQDHPKATHRLTDPPVSHNLEMIHIPWAEGRQQHDDEIVLIPLFQ